MNNILLVRNVLFSRIKSFILIFLSLLLCAGILMGCGSSGDGGSGNENEAKSDEGTEDILPAAESTEGLKWDEKQWDQSEWG